MAQQLRVHVALAETWVQFPAPLWWLRTTYDSSSRGIWCPLLISSSTSPALSECTGIQTGKMLIHIFLKTHFIVGGYLHCFHVLTVTEYCCEHCCCQHWLQLCTWLRFWGCTWNCWLIWEHSVPLLAVSSGQQKTCFICHLSSRNQVLHCPIDVQCKNSCFMCFCLIFLFLVHHR